MPYQIRVRDPADDTLGRLVDLGALDVERSGDDGIAALMPDSVTLERVAAALARDDITVAPAIARDAGSVWTLTPRAFSVGRVHIVPAHIEADTGSLRLLDTPVFGTGLHATTALCLEALDAIVAADAPDAVLDVGCGSGVLALAALTLGVPRATAIDVDADAIRVAAENARINRLRERLRLIRGGPESLRGRWPLVLANVLAAPLVEMAPALARCVGHHGRLVLSGIPHGVGEDVIRAYRHLGMRQLSTTSRGGWIALTVQSTW